MSGFRSPLEGAGDDPEKNWEEILRHTIANAKERHESYTDLLAHLRHRWQAAESDKEKREIHERIRRAIRMLEEDEKLIAAAKEDIADIQNEQDRR
jgi:hypothetical protein